MTNSETVDPTVAWLQGFLHAFAWFNNKTNYGYTFTLDIIPKSDSVERAITAYFGGDLDGLVLSPVEDWPTFLRELLESWLFQFRDPLMDHLKDPTESFSLFHAYFRSMLLDETIRRLSGVANPVSVWKVEVRTRGWYECYYEDVAFEQQDRVLYLHTGFSD